MPLVALPGGGLYAVVTIYNPQGGLLIHNAAADTIGGHIKFEDTPSGCGAAEIQLGLYWETAFADGYWTARNICEISLEEDFLTAAIAGGGTTAKLYVNATTVYQAAYGFIEQQSLFLFDGIQTVTTGLVVTSVGSDGGGPFVNVSSATTIPAYGLGAIVGRRRYCGQIVRRALQNDRDPVIVLSLQGMVNRLNEAFGTFSQSAQEVSVALYNCISSFSSRFPELTVSSGNFAVTTFSYTGTKSSTSVLQMAAEILTAVSDGSSWVVRVGHDRIVRFLKIYDGPSNTYTYTVLLNQGVNVYEALSVKNVDQDCSALYNSIEVTGNTGAGGQPVSAICQDATSIALYGQIDGQPVTNQACLTTAACTLYGNGLLKQFSLARQNASLRTYSINQHRSTGSSTPPSYQQASGTTLGKGTYLGDAISGVHCITIENFEGGVPNVYGLAVSVQSTIDITTCDAYQDTTFSAVEPDWNAAMKERTNALATALLLNGSSTNAGQFFVSASAYPFSTVGLTLHVPAFFATFTAGSTEVSVTAWVVTLFANTTNWVWLNPNNTWNVLTNNATISGAILYAVAQTSSTAVIGSVNKATVGELSLTNLPSMGAEATTAPVVTVLAGPTYPVVGNGTYDAQVNLSVDIATASWLVGLGIFAVKAGTVVSGIVGGIGTNPDIRDFYKGSISVYESAAGVYNVIWKGLGAGNAEDLYVAYEDGQGRYSLARYVCTTAANPAGTTAFGSIGTAAPSPVSAASAFGYSENGGGTYDADFTIYLNTNGTTANNALAELEVVVAPHSRGLSSSATGWASVGNAIAKNGTGVYPCTAGGMGVQVAYDVGVRYIGHDGNRSYVYIIGTTTSVQLAQIPFLGTTIDPTTGYLLVTDAAPHLTPLIYTLLSAGVGSLLSISIDFIMSGNGSTQITNPTLWLFAVANGGSTSYNGYMLYWYSGNPPTNNPAPVYIFKVTPTAYTAIAVSGLNYVKDQTYFHNMEFIATETTSGTIQLTGILDGTIVVQGSDSSSPYSSGACAVNFREYTGTNYIDLKTIEINLGGSPSSTSLKSIGTVTPGSIPLFQLYVASPTNTGVRQFQVFASALLFSDGSTYNIPANFFVNDFATANGTWYYGLSINLATGAPVWYLSQTPPSTAQLMALLGDGLLSVTLNQSISVAAGGAATVYNLGNTIQNKYSG